MPRSPTPIEANPCDAHLRLNPGCHGGGRGLVLVRDRLRKGVQQVEAMAVVARSLGMLRPLQEAAFNR